MYWRFKNSFKWKNDFRSSFFFIATKKLQTTYTSIESIRTLIDDKTKWKTTAWSMERGNGIGAEDSINRHLTAQFDAPFQCFPFFLSTPSLSLFRSWALTHFSTQLIRFTDACASAAHLRVPRCLTLRELFTCSTVKLPRSQIRVIEEENAPCDAMRCHILEVILIRQRFMTENANDIDNSFRFVHLKSERARSSSIFISILNTYIAFRPVWI